MSCSCSGGAGKKCGGNCGSKKIRCDGSCDGTELRLDAFRRHEPGCADSASRCRPRKRKSNWSCEALVEALVCAGVAARHEGCLIFHGHNGGPPIRVKESVLCETNVYGPHFGCERRDSTLAPEDVEAVIQGYGEEEIAVIGDPDDPGVNIEYIGGEWFRIVLGPIGVSHTFCFDSLELLFGTGAGQAVVATRIGVAGEDIACRTGGGYIRVWNRPETGSADSLEVTEYRCRCDNDSICAWTPGRGGEAILVRLPGFDPTAANIATLRGTLSLKRCNWLSGPPSGECCVENINGRVPSVEATDLAGVEGVDTVYTGLLRIEIGLRVYLPGVDLP